jgi:hypothetical protein
MSTKTALAALLVIGLMAFGCDNPTPTSPELSQIPKPGTGSGSIQSAPGPMAAQQGGATKVPIAGSFDLISFGDIECRETPGGVVQCRGGFAETAITGDLDGIMVFTYQTDKWKEFSEWFNETGGGRFDGTVTWNTHTGLIDGTWAAICQPPKTPCNGTMIAHGSGDLAGLKFQIKWSGLWPMAYDGFALDPHGG